MEKKQTREFCFRDGVHEIEFIFYKGSIGSYWQPPEDSFVEVYSIKNN